MNQINKEEFFKKVSQLTEIDNIEVNEDIVLKLEGHAKVFSNCKFKGLIVQNHSNNISFHNCSFQYLDFSLGQSLSAVKIDNCQANSIRVSGKSNVVLHELIISGSTTNLGKLNFDGGFHCFEIKLAEIKKIEKGTFEVNCDTLDLINVENVEYLVIYGEVKRQLNIEKCHNLEFLLIRDLKSERVEFSDSSKLDVQLETLNVKYINFTRCNETSVETTYLTADHIGFSEGSFKKIQFYHGCYFNLKTSSRSESPLKIESLIFSASNISKDKTLNFEDVLLKKTIIGGIHNEGLIHFLNCEINDGLEVFKSNLGKFQFTNVKIKDSCRIDLLDSNINDVLFNSFRWNRNYQLFEEFDPWVNVRFKTKLNFLYSLRESYRQLKANYLKQGNKIESLEFQKREMIIHFKILKSIKFKSWRNLGNYLIVATNKWFSDFGQNIWKPIVWLSVSHLVIFNLIAQSFNLGFEPAISFDSIDATTTIKGINLFFHTLLPTHFATVKDYGGKDVSIAGVLDFLDRILSGYFIYYFLSASRKYHQ